MVSTGCESNPGQQQSAARGGQIADQLREGLRIAKREAQQHLLLVGLGEQRQEFEERPPLPGYRQTVR